MYKPRIGFLFRKNQYFLSGKHFDNCFYNFYFKAFPRNEKIEFLYFSTDGVFDISNLNNKIDALVLFDVAAWGGPDKIINIEKLKMPIFFYAGDAHKGSVVIKPSSISRIELAKLYRLKNCFTHHNPKFFYKFWPKEFNLFHIFPGVEPSIYKNLPPFNERIKNCVLNTGNLNSNYYKLRILLNTSKYIKYISKTTRFSNDNFPKLLGKYAASTAVAGRSLVMKYLEVPAAGCLTFMGLNETNEADILGFIDGFSCIYINIDNYDGKLEEYIKTNDDPKWQRIAEEGQRFVFENYTNDKQAEKLIDLIVERI